MKKLVLFMTAVKPKIVTALFIVLIPFMVSAEVNWVFQAGGWYSKGYGGINGVRWDTEYVNGKRIYNYRKTENISLSLGLYLQIPLSSRVPLFLETGLGWINRPFFSLDENSDFDPNHPFGNPNELNKGFAGNFIDLPIKAGYRLNLNEKNAFEFGLGPYMSYLCENDVNGDQFSVGTTASVVFRHRCMSFGVSYSNPIFRNGMNDYHKNNLLFTIGINFGSNSWSNIGNAMMIAGQVAGSVADSYATYNSYKSGGYSGESSSGYSSSSVDSRSSSGSNDKGFSLSENQAYNSDKRTYENYDTQLSKYFAGLSSMSKSQVHDIQNKMKKIREKWQARGKQWTQVPNETRR